MKQDEIGSRTIHVLEVIHIRFIYHSQLLPWDRKASREQKWEGQKTSNKMRVPLKK